MNPTTITIMILMTTLPGSTDAGSWKQRRGRPDVGTRGGGQGRAAAARDPSLPRGMAFAARDHDGSMTIHAVACAVIEPTRRCVFSAAPGSYRRRRAVRALLREVDP